MILKEDDQYRNKQILREIQILKEFTKMGARNNYTTKISEIFVEKNDVYLILDYLETDLKVLVQRIEYDEKHLIRIIHSLLSSIHFVHSAGIVHRDIKPSNMLISRNLEFRICDFGLSRTMPEESKT